MKFQRTWNATIQVSDTESITIGYPLTINFFVTRNTLRSANSGTFRIYNLSERNRFKVFHDRYRPDIYRRVTVRAGYMGEPKLPVIFDGNMLVAQSSRQGVDWITSIDALDGGFGIINSQFSNTVPSGYNLRDVMENMIGSMKNISLGKIGAFTSDNTRGLSISGNTWDELNKLIKDGDAFVDNGVVNVLRTSEYLAPKGEIPVINSDTGLIGSPTRTETAVDVKVIFEPRFHVGQVAKLESSEKVFNGTYKIVGISHAGTISEAVGGEVITTSNLYGGPLLRGV